MQRLREAGWVDGRTTAIEYRSAVGHSEQFDEIMAEFVRLNVDVIVTGGIAVPAAKRATSGHPDCLRAGAGPRWKTSLVASLARPGGNVAGLSNQSGDLLEQEN